MLAQRCLILYFCKVNLHHCWTFWGKKKILHIMSSFNCNFFCLYEYFIFLVLDYSFESLRTGLGLYVPCCNTNLILLYSINFIHLYITSKYTHTVAIIIRCNTLILTLENMVILFEQLLSIFNKIYARCHCVSLNFS